MPDAVNTDGKYDILDLVFRSNFNGGRGDRSFVQSFKSSSCKTYPSYRSPFSRDRDLDLDLAWLWSSGFLVKGLSFKALLFLHGDASLEAA